MAQPTGQIDPAVLDHIPLQSPPPGIIPNFSHPASRSQEPALAIYVLVPIMLVLLLLRVWTRLRISRVFGIDDHLTIVSAILVGLYCGILRYMLQGPTGKHSWDVPVSAYNAAYVKDTLVQQCLYSLSSLFVKVSLLALYLRIFTPVDHARIMIWAGCVCVATFYLACGAAYVILSVPSTSHRESWNIPTSRATGERLLNLTSVIGVVSIVTDLYTLFIPVQLVAQLNLPLGRKLGVGALFLTGLGACVCSIISTVIRFRLRTTHDPLWDATPQYTLTVVELNIGIICGCMPVIFVFFKKASKNDTYQAFMKRFRTSLPRSSKEQPGLPTGSGADARRIRLAIPKPIITGLRSLIHKMHHNEHSPPVESIATESYNDLDSGPYDYHKQLRAMEMNSSQ